MKKKFDVFFDKDNALYQVRTKNNTTLIEFTLVQDLSAL